MLKPRTQPCKSTILCTDPCLTPARTDPYPDLFICGIERPCALHRNLVIDFTNDLP
jgi:hypothetical protein